MELFVNNPDCPNADISDQIHVLNKIWKTYFYKTKQKHLCLTKTSPISKIKFKIRKTHQKKSDFEELPLPLNRKKIHFAEHSPPLIADVIYVNSSLEAS